MAVAFTDLFTGSFTFSYFADLKNFDTLETSLGNVSAAAVMYRSTNNGYESIMFYASTADKYSDIVGGVSTSYAGDVAGINTAGTVFGNIPLEAKWLDNYNKDEVADRELTQAANAVPWFSYTNATLYENLRQLYPGFHSFAMIGTLTAPSRMAGEPHQSPPDLPARYNYLSGSGSFGSCINAPGVSGNIIGYTPTGLNYDGFPSELGEDNWASPLALGAFLLLSEGDSYKIKIDMYINGQASPSIGVEWTMYRGSDQVETDAFLDNAKVKVYAFAPYINQIPGQFTQVDDGIRTVSDFALVYGRQKLWDLTAGSNDFIDTLYNAIAADCMRGMSDALIIGNYGINKLPEKLFWYFQIESEDEQNGTQRSSLWQLIEPREWESLFPDHQLHEFTDGETAYNSIALEVVLHSGQSENMDGDDDNDGNGDDGDGGDGNHGDEWPDFDPYIPTGFNGNNVLTKMYAMTATVLANVGNKLWTQSYFDVLKVQNNPIENIVSVKWFPFNPSGTLETIKIGDVEFTGIQAAKINRMKVIDIGSFKYTGRTGLHNFLDQTPFTECQLHLPYIGTYQIDASFIFKNTLAVKYYVDLCTGECMAAVTIDGAPYLNATGMMGVDIPITSSDRVQTEMKVMGSALKTGAGISGEVLSGDILGAAAGAATGALSIAGADYTQQRTNNPSSACGSFQSHAVYLTFAYPDSFSTDGYGLRTTDTGYAHTKGYPCHAWKMLRSFGDFVIGANGEATYRGKPYFIQIDKRTELNIGMTGDENAELERLLTEGVYI